MLSRRVLKFSTTEGEDAPPSGTIYQYLKKEVFKKKQEGRCYIFLYLLTLDKHKTF